jgi:hypothetical protein
MKITYTNLQKSFTTSANLIILYSLSLTHTRVRARTRTRTHTQKANLQSTSQNDYSVLQVTQICLNTF